MAVSNKHIYIYKKKEKKQRWYLPEAAVGASVTETVQIHTSQVIISAAHVFTCLT